MAEGFVEGLAGGRGCLDELIVIIIFVVIASDFLNLASGGALRGIEEGYYYSDGDGGHDGSNHADNDAAAIGMGFLVEAFGFAKTRRLGDWFAPVGFSVFG